MNARMMNRIGWGLFAVALLSAWPPAAFGQPGPATERVTSEGFEAIIGGNEMLACDKAEDQALRSAVERVAGTIVSAESLVENFQLVEDRVYTQARGFIQTYKILSKGSAGDGTCRVVVEAVVARKMLEESLRDIVQTTMAVTNKPRTLFMIAEQHVGEEVWHAWWLTGGVTAHARSFNFNTVESIFQQQFTDNGFPVVDLSAASGSMENGSAYQVLELTDSQARELGSRLNAEIVIIGKALARKGNRILNSPMYTFTGTLTARAIHVDTGRVITTTSKSANFPHSITEQGGTEVLQRVASEAAEEMMPKMVASLQNKRSVEIEVSYDRYKNLVQFKEALKSAIRGVERVHQRQAGDGVARLEVDLKSGTAQGVADELAVREFRDFYVEVKEVTQNTILLGLIQR